MKKTITISVSVLVFTCVTLFSSISYAQPYGKGLYGLIEYGSETSLSIATSGNVNIANITPVTGGTLGTGTSTVTVTSTDVVGFKLYIRSLSNTDMNNLGAVIPTSANGAPATLATNTWGYNTNGSANFVGITLSDVQIKSVTAPAPAGNVTTFTYGLNVDLAKPAGNYTTSIVYTAVPQTD